MVQGIDSDEIMLWNDSFGGGFFSSEQLQHTQFDSVKAKNNFNSGFESSEQLISKRIMIRTDTSEQEMEVNSSEEASALGLRLRKTPSFLNLVEMMLYQESTRNYADDTQMDDFDFASQPMSEKLKASNFPAKFIKIGSWERYSMYEGELVAKCYYAKHKLVWEILDGGLKSKIEMQWSEIIGIRATIHDGEPDILEIELENAPVFYREIDPKPRKHTLWRQDSDFTGGQAQIFRRHYLKFPPGTLDRHYKKLLQCDPRLLRLSKRPFPSEEFPYNYSNNYGISCDSFNFSGRCPEIPLPGLQHHSTTFIHPHPVLDIKTTPSLPLRIVDSNSPMSVMDFPPAYENVNNYAHENQSLTLWGQGGGGHNLATSVQACGDQFQGLPFSPENYHQMNYAMPNPNPNPSTQVLGDFENHLLGGSQIMCYDEERLITKMRSMGLLLESFEEPKVNNNISEDILDLKHIDQCIGYDQSNFSTIVSSRVEGDLLCLHPPQCVPPQVPNDNLMTDLRLKDSFNFTNPMVENFAAGNTGNEFRHWT